MALGRPSADVEAWREIRAQVLARAQWRCQACRVRTRLEVHHVVKRAQGGSDFDLEDAAGRPILRRFWGTACPRDEVVYVVLFINERCLVFALSG